MPFDERYASADFPEFTTEPFNAAIEFGGDRLDFVTELVERLRRSLTSSLSLVEMLRIRSLVWPDSSSRNRSVLLRIRVSNRSRRSWRSLISPPSLVEMLRIRSLEMTDKRIWMPIKATPKPRMENKTVNGMTMVTTDVQRRLLKGLSRRRQEAEGA